MTSTLFMIWDFEEKILKLSKISDKKLLLPTAIHLKSAKLLRHLVELMKKVIAILRQIFRVNNIGLRIFIIRQILMRQVTHV